MIFNAHTLARSWLSVALAESDDPSRSSLYRTTLIEQFPTGVRLVATDSFLLLKAWVPAVMWKDSAEPGNDELPEEVAICRDIDHRVMGLMKYALKLSAKDGAETNLRLRMGVGDAPVADGQLAGLNEPTVWFQFDEFYDERIEVKQYEGTYPEWRGLFFNHRWESTGVVSFGAGGILRLGKLSSLWGGAPLRFFLGGQSGIAKVQIIARDAEVNVTGLAMPARDDIADDSAPVDVIEMPASDEGLAAQYADEVEKFLADVFAMEVPRDQTGDAVDDAVEAQIKSAGRACIDAGYGSGELLVTQLGVKPARAVELLKVLVDRGIIGASDVDSDDKMLRQATELVVRSGAASSRTLQSKMKVGRARADKLLDLLEQRGVVGPFVAAIKGREVLMTVEQLDAMPEHDLSEKFVVLVDSIDEPEEADDQDGDEEPI